MGLPEYRPQKDHHLAAKIGLRVKDRPAFRALLKDLSAEGLVVKKKGNCWALAGTSNKQVEGTLSLSPRGHGFLRLTYPVDGLAELFIPPDSVGGALHGDKVLCDIVPRKHFRGSKKKVADFKTEGRIVKILERKKNQLVGLLMKSSVYWYVIPDSPRMSQNVYVTCKKKVLKEKLSKGRHKVVVKLNEDQDGEKLTGLIIEDLGDPDAPGVDVVSVLRHHRDDR